MKTVNRHLGEGTLQALLDGELSPPEHAAAEAHLAGCPSCAAELRDLRALNERMAGLLALGDHPAPVAQAQMRMRARRLRSTRTFSWQAALLRAAVLVLAFAGVAAATVPGSPVREWIALRFQLMLRPSPVPRVETPGIGCACWKYSSGGATTLLRWLKTSTPAAPTSVTLSRSVPNTP